MALHSLPLPGLAALSEFPPFWESVQFQLSGLVVVFIALGGIWALLELMGFVFRRIPAKAARPETPRSAPASSSAPAAASANTQPASPPSSEIPPEVCAVIAAAVHVVTLGRPYRIASVTALDSALDWAREGRRAIFSSHKTH